MITKKVSRYYCEYCKKSGCAARWIKKHEQRCTLNPNRYCGLCNLLDIPQPEIEILFKILPDPQKYKTEDEYGISYNGLEEAVEKVMKKLREACNNCPICIMAALRQKGIPVPIVQSFDFKSECQSVLSEFNHNQMVKEQQQYERHYEWYRA